MTGSGYASPDSISGVTITFAAIATVVVCLRLWTRLRVVRNAGLDDAFITAALLCTIALTICTCLEVKYGLGRHLDTLDAYERVMVLKTNYIAIAIYVAALLSVKLAIMMQYLRIFPTPRFRVVCWTLLVVVCCSSTTFFWLGVLMCRPIKAYWMPGLEGSHCVSEAAVWFTHAASNILTDLAIAILPLPMLKQLQIAKNQKLGLMMVFALGGFTCIISILRLQSIYALTTTTDQSYNGGTAAMWSAMEVNIGIICSCIPTLKGLAQKWFPKKFSSQQFSHRSSSGFELSGGRKTKSTRSYQGEQFLERGTNISNAHAYASRGSVRSIDGLDLDAKDIHVVTVVGVERETRERPQSETSSERQLVYPESTFHTARNSDMEY